MTFFYICQVLGVLGERLSVQVQTTNAKSKGLVEFYVPVSAEYARDTWVNITFPVQYPLDFLEIPTCRALLPGSPSTGDAAKCAVTARSVSISVSVLPITLSLEGVTNPPVPCITDPFWLEVSTTEGERLLLNFGTVTITDPPATLDSVEIYPRSEPEANRLGGLQTFTFAPTLVKAVDNGSWALVTFPAGFTGVGLACKVSNEVKACETVRSAFLAVRIDGISAYLPGDILHLEIQGVKNPLTTGQIGHFSVAIYAPNSHHQTQTSVALEGVYTAKVLSAVSVTWLQTVSHVNWLEYIISFKVGVAVPQSATVEVVFPSEISIKDSCAAKQFSSCEYRSNLLTLHIAAGGLSPIATYSVSVHASRPLVSSVFQVFIKAADSTLIAYSLNAGRYRYMPGTASAGLYRAAKEVRAGESGSLQLTLLCEETDLQLPPTTNGDGYNSSGKIVVTLPQYVEVDSPIENKLSCVFEEGNIEAHSCEWNNDTKQVTVMTPSIVDSCPLALSISVLGTSGFLFPVTLTNTHIVRLQTWAQPLYSPAEELINDGFLTLQLRSGKLPVLQVKSLNLPKDDEDIITVELKSSIELPEGFSVEIDIDNSDQGLTIPQSIDCFAESSKGFSECIAQTNISSIVLVARGGRQSLLTTESLILTFLGVKSQRFIQSREFTVRILVEDFGTSIEVETSTVRLNYMQITQVPLITVSISPSRLSLTTPTEQLMIGLSGAVIASEDTIEISLPEELKWADVSATSLSPSIPITTCNGDSATQYISAHRRVLLVKVSTAIEASKQLCVRLDTTFQYKITSILQVRIISSNSVVARGSATIGGEAEDMTIDVRPFPFDDSMIRVGETSLLRIELITKTTLESTGSIVINLRESDFESEAKCYSLSRDFDDYTDCSYPGIPVSIEGQRYHQVIISGWKSPLLPGSKVVTIYGTPRVAEVRLSAFTSSADSAFSAAVDKSAEVQLTASTGKRSTIELGEFQRTISKAKAGEYADLIFKLTLLSDTTVPASTSLVDCGYVEIAVPLRGLRARIDPNSSTLDTFSMDSDCHLYCSINDLQAALCEFRGTAIRVYTPSTLALSKGTEYSILISAEDVVGRRGLLLPQESGHYNFQLTVFECSDATLVAEASRWVLIPPSHSFSSASASLLSTGAGEPSAVFFSLTLTQPIKAREGFLTVYFPLTDSKGNGWESDLGTGLPDASDIDCNAAVHSFLCTLRHGGNGEPAAVHLATERDIPAATALEFNIVGVLNPRAQWYTVSLRITSCKWASEVSSAYCIAQEEATLDFVATIVQGQAVTAVPQSMGINGSSEKVVFLLQVPGVQGVDWALVKLSDNSPLDSSAYFFGSVHDDYATHSCHSYIIGHFSTPQESASVFTVGSVLAPAYSTTVQTILYLYSGGKHTYTLTYQHTFPVKTMPAGTISVVGSLYQGEIDTYCFQLQSEYGVRATSAVLISLPAAYAQRIIAETCVIRAFTPPERTLVDGKCEVHGDTNVLVTQLTSAVVEVEVCVDITNPPPAAGGHTGFRFDLFLDRSLTQHCEEYIYGSTIDTIAWTTPSPHSSASFMSRLVGDHARKGDIEPLKLAFAATNLLTAGCSLTVDVSPAVDVTQQELRCIWANPTVSEVAAEHCEVSSPSASVTRFQSTCPIDTSTGMITITTGGSVQSGLRWSESGIYTIEITAESQQSVVIHSSRVYLTVDESNLQSLAASFDHTEADNVNSLQITFTVSDSVPNWVNGGRVVVEFPIAVFAEDLGFGQNHAEVPCISAKLSAEVICYVQTGDSRIGQNPAVVVTGFPEDIQSGDSVNIRLFGVKNPVTQGSAAEITVKTVDVHSGWPGTVLQQGRLQQLFVATGASPQYTGDLSITFSNSAVLAESSYTFLVQINESARFLAKDCLYVSMDSRIGVTDLRVTQPPVSSFQYFPGLHTLRMTLSSEHISPLAVTIEGVKNPGSVLATGLTVSAVLVRNERIQCHFVAVPTSKDFITPAFPNAMVDGIGLTMTMYQGDVLDWDFHIWLSLPIPAGGGIALRLIASTFDDTICINYEEGGSQLEGSYVCTASNQLAVVTLHSPQSPNTHVRLLARVRNSGPSATVSTLSDASDPRTLIEASAPVGIAVSTIPAPRYHEIPVQVYAQELVRDYGSLEFVVTLGQGILADGKLQVDFPGLRGLAFGGELVCLWQVENSEAVVVPLDSCTVDGVNTWGDATSDIVSFIIKAAIPAGRITVTLTTRNAANPEGQGLRYPREAADVQVDITVCYTLLDCQTVTDTVAVVPENRFRELEIKYGHRHKAEPNWFQVKITPGSAISDTGMLVLQFPTNDGRSRLFLPDLGLGLENNAAIECSEYEEITCEVVWGDDHQDRPAEVRIYSNAGFGTEESFTFTLLGIKNPPVGGDTVHVHITVYSYDNGRYKDFQTVPYLFTVLDESPPEKHVLTSPLPIVTLTEELNMLVLITYPGNFVVTETSLVVISLTFPVSYYDSISTIENGEVWLRASTNQISIYGVSSGVYIMYSSNLPYFPIGDTVTLTLMNDGRIVSKIQLPPIFGLVGDDGSVPRLYSQHAGGREIFAGVTETVMLSYTVALPIPAEGCVRFTLFPESVHIDPQSCHTPKADNAVRCDIQRNTIVLNEFSEGLDVDEELTVFVNLQTQEDIVASVETFAGRECSLRPISATFCDECDANYLTTVASFKSLEVVMQPPEVTKSTAGAGDRAELRFTLRPRGLVPATPVGALRINSDENTMAAWYQQIAAGEQLSCSIESSQEKIPAPCLMLSNFIEIKVGGDLRAGALYTVTVTTKGRSELVGLQMPDESGRKALRLQTLANGMATDTGMLYFELPPEKITKLSITPAHYTAAEYNVWTIELEVTAALVQSDTVVVEFPLQTEDRQTDLFAADLGTGLRTGGRLPCFTDVATACELRVGAANSPAQVVITGLSGTTPKFVIAGIFNPNVSAEESSTAFAYMRVLVTHSDGSVVADRTLVDVCTFVRNAVNSDQPASWGRTRAVYPSTNEFVTLVSSFSPETKVTAVILRNLAGGTELPDLASADFPLPAIKFSSFNVVYSTNLFESFSTTGASKQETTQIEVYYIGYESSEIDSRLKVLSKRHCELQPLSPRNLAGAISLPRDLCDYWQFCRLTIGFDFELRTGSYLALELMGEGGFAAVDPNFLEATQLPFLPQYHWDADKGWFVIPLEKPVPALPEFKIFAKVIASATFKASVFEDSGLTALIATTTSVSPVTCSTGGAAEMRVSVSFTPELTANSGYTIIAPSFKPTAPQFDVVGSLSVIKIDFSQENMVCNALYDIGDATSQIHVESGMITLTTSVTLATVKPWTLTITSSNPVCTTSVPGYYIAIFQASNSGVFLNHGVAKLYAKPQASFLSFTMSSFTLNASSASVYDLQFSPSVAMPGGSTLVIEFPSCCFLSNLGLLSGPSTPAQYGDKVPFSGTSLEHCYQRTLLSSQFQGNQFPIRVVCVVQAAGIEAGASVTVHFPMITTPSIPSSMVFRLKHFQPNNETTQCSSLTIAKPADSVACGLDAYSSETNFLSLSPASPGALSTFTFSIPTMTDDKILIAFGSEIGDIAAAQSSDALTLIPGPYPCPCVLLVAAAERSEFSISDLRLPVIEVQYHLVQVYRFRGGSCLQGKTCGYDLEAPPLQIDINADGLNPVMRAGSPITITMFVPAVIPENSALQISIEGLQGLDVSYSHLIPTLLTAVPLQVDGLMVTATALRHTSAGSTVALWNLVAQSCSPTVIITAQFSIGEKVLTEGSISATCDGSANYLRQQSLYFLTNTLWTQARSDPKSQSDFVQVKLFLNLQSSLQTSDYLDLSFSSGFTGAVRAYFQQGTKRVDSVASSLNPSSPVTYRVYPLSALDAAGWTLCVSAFDGEKYGLRYDPEADFSLTASIASEMYQADSTRFPRGTMLESLLVNPITYSNTVALPFAISFQPSQPLPSVNYGEIVVQLPGLSPNPTENLYTGQECEVAVTPSSPSRCKFVFGGSSTELEEKRYPPTFIISGVDLQAETTVSVLLPPLKRTVGAVSDVVVYTRWWDFSNSEEAGREKIVNLWTVRNAIFTVPQTPSESSRTVALSDYEVRKTGVTYTFPVAADGVRMLLHIPKAYPAYSFDIQLPSVVTLRLSSFVYLASLTPIGSELEVTDVRNINYIPTTLEETAITIYSASSTYELSVIQFTVESLDRWQAIALTSGIEPLSVYKSFQDYYTLTATISSASFPSGSVLVVHFPNEFESLHWLVRSSAAVCSVREQSWVCSIPSSSTASVTVSGRATGAAVSSSAAIHLSLFADSTLTGTIATGAIPALQFVGSTAPIRVPDGCFVPLQREYHRYPVKANEAGELALIFTPIATIAHGGDSMTVTDVTSAFPMAEGTQHLRCLFEDTHTHILHAAASCSATGHQWTVFPPLHTDLTSAKKWKLRISTSGLERTGEDSIVYDGITFPSGSHSRYALRMTFPTGDVFDETVANVMAVPRETTLTVISTAKGQRNTQYILDFFPAIPRDTIKLSLLFPTSLFGATVSDRPLGADFGCSAMSDVFVFNAEICTLQSIDPGYSAARVVQLTLHNPNQYPLKRVVFGGITNPLENAWVGVRETALGTEPVVTVERLAIFPFAVIVTEPVALAPYTAQGPDYFAGQTVTDLTVPFSSSAEGSMIVATFSFKLTGTESCGTDNAILDLKTLVCANSIIGGELILHDLPSIPASGSANILVQVYRHGKLVLATNLSLSVSPAAASIDIYNAKIHTWSLLKVEFTVPVAEGQSLTVTFPQSVLLGACQCENWSAVRYGENFCMAKESIVSIQMESPLSHLSMSLWAQITTPSLEVTVEVFTSADRFGHGTKAISLSPTTAFKAVSHSYAVLQRGDLGELRDSEVLRPLLSSGCSVGSDTVSLSLQFTLNPLTEVRLEVEPQLIPTDTKLACTWLSPAGVVLPSSSCTFANSVVLVQLPPGAVSGGTWGVRITSQSGGFAPASGFGREYELTAQHLGPRGNTLSLPSSSTGVELSVFGAAVSAPNLLEILIRHFSETLTDSIGSEGESEILVLFNGLDKPLGSLNFGAENSGVIGCALPSAAGVTVTCTVHGNAVRVRLFPVSSYDSDIKIVVGPFANPSAIGACVHVEVRVQRFTELIERSFMFHYLFATVSAPISATGSADWERDYIHPSENSHILFTLPQNYGPESTVLFILQGPMQLFDMNSVQSGIQYAVPVANAMISTYQAETFPSLTICCVNQPTYETDLSWKGWVYEDGQCTAIYTFPGRSFRAQQTLALSANVSFLSGGAEVVIGLKPDNSMLPAQNLFIYLSQFGTNQEMQWCTVNSSPTYYSRTCEPQQNVLVLKEPRLIYRQSTGIVVTVALSFGTPVAAHFSVYAELVASSSELVTFSNTVEIGVSVPTLALIAPICRSPERPASAGDSTFLHFSFIPEFSSNFLELTSYPSVLPLSYSYCSIMLSVESLPCFSYWDSHTLKVQIDQSLTTGMKYTVSIGYFNLPSLSDITDYQATGSWWHARYGTLIAEDIIVSAPVSASKRMGQFDCKLGLGIEGTISFMDVKVNPALVGIELNVQKTLSLLLQSPALFTEAIECQALQGTAAPTCTASASQHFQVKIALADGFLAGNEYRFRVFGVGALPVSVNISGTPITQSIAARFVQTEYKHVRFISSSPEVESSRYYLLIPKLESQSVTAAVGGCTATSEEAVTLSITFSALESPAVLIVLEMPDFDLSDLKGCSVCTARSYLSKQWAVVTMQSPVQTFSIVGVKMPRDPLDSGYAINIAITTAAGSGMRGATSCSSVNSRNLVVTVDRSAVSESEWSPYLEWSTSNLSLSPRSFDYWIISFPANSLSPTLQTIKILFPAYVEHILVENMFTEENEASLNAVFVTFDSVQTMSVPVLSKLKVAVLLSKDPGSGSVALEHYRSSGELIASGASGTITTGTVSFPYRAVLHFASDSYALRETAINDFGELLVRIKPGFTVLAATNVVVSIPSTVDYSELNPQCSVTAREMQIFESGWINAKCTWISNRRLNVTLPAVQKPHWKDVVTESCFWLRVISGFHPLQASSDLSVTVETHSESLHARLSVPQERSDKKVQLLVEGSDLLIGYANHVKMYARERMPAAVNITLNSISTEVHIEETELQLKEGDTSGFFTVRIPCRFKDDTLTLQFTVSDSAFFFIDAVTLRVKKPQSPDRDGLVTDWRFEINDNHLKMNPATDLPGIITWTLSPTTGNEEATSDISAFVTSDDWVMAHRQNYTRHLQQRETGVWEVYGNDDSREFIFSTQPWRNTAYRLTGSLDNCYTNYDPPVSFAIVRSEPVPPGKTIRVTRSERITAIGADKIIQSLSTHLGIEKSRLKLERRISATSADITLLPSMLLHGQSPAEIFTQNPGHSEYQQMVDRNRILPQWLEFPEISSSGPDFLEVTLRSSVRGQLCCVAAAPIAMIDATDVARQALLGLDLSMHSVPQQCADTAPDAAVTLRIGYLRPGTTYSVLCGASDDFLLPTQPLLSAYGLLGRTTELVNNCVPPSLSGVITPVQLQLSPSNAGEQNTKLILTFKVNFSITNSIVEVGFPAGFDLSSLRVFVPVLSTTTENVVTIPGIRNPTKADLYGPFTLKTHCDWSAKVVESNRVFGFVEVAQSPKSFEVLQFSIEPLRTGEFSVSLKLSVESGRMWQYEEFAIRVSPRWILSKLDCEVVNATREALQCYQEDSTIVFAGLHSIHISDIVTVRIGTFVRSQTLLGHWRVTARKIGSPFYYFNGIASEIGRITEINATTERFVRGTHKLMTLSFRLPSGLPAGGSILITANQEFEECAGPGQVSTERIYSSWTELYEIQPAGTVDLQCSLEVQSQPLIVSIETYSGAVEQSTVVDQVINWTLGKSEELLPANLIVSMEPNSNGYIDKLLLSIQAKTKSEDINVSISCPFSSTLDSHSIYVEGSIKVGDHLISPPFGSIDITVPNENSLNVELSGRFLFLEASNRKFECSVTLTQGDSQYFAAYQFNAPKDENICIVTSYGQSLVKIDSGPLVAVSANSFLELSIPLDAGILLPSVSASRERVEETAHFVTYLTSKSLKYSFYRDAEYYNFILPNTYPYLPLQLNLQNKEVRVRQFLLHDSKKLVYSDSKCEMLSSRELSGEISIQMNSSGDSVSIEIPGGMQAAWISFSSQVQLNNLEVEPNSTFFLSSTPSAGVLILKPSPKFTLTGILAQAENATVTVLAALEQDYSLKQTTSRVGDFVTVSSISPTKSTAREVGVLHTVTLNIARELPAGAKIELEIARDWLSSGCTTCTTDVVDSVCGMCGNTVQIVPSSESLQLSVSFRGLTQPFLLSSLSFLETLTVRHPDSTVMQRSTLTNQNISIESPNKLSNSSLIVSVTPSMAPNKRATAKITLTLGRVLPQGTDLYFLSTYNWTLQGDVSAHCQQSFAVSCFAEGKELKLTFTRESWATEVVLLEKILSIQTGIDKLWFSARWRGRELVPLGYANLIVKSCTIIKTETFSFFPRSPGIPSTYYFTLPGISDDSDEVWVDFPYEYGECMSSALHCYSPGMGDLQCNCRERTLIAENSPSGEAIALFIGGVKNPGPGVVDTIQVYRVRAQKQCWFQEIKPTAPVAQI